MKYFYEYNTKICKIAIAENKGYITDILLNSDRKINYDITKKETELIKQTISEIQEYFNGNRKAFSVPIKPHGTDFQLKVWNGLLKIPYGETRSYKNLANFINCKNEYRAIGMANSKNPIPIPILITIPYHRVINYNGTLSGFSYRLNLKIKLLNIEKLYKN